MFFLQQKAESKKAYAEFEFVESAIRRHLDLGTPMQTLDLVTPLKDEFVNELFSTLPCEFAANAKIQFCSPCGTDAVEAALKLVKTATGRSGIWASSGVSSTLSEA